MIAKVFIETTFIFPPPIYLAMTKAISAVIATIMLLMITVALIGVFYVFSSTLATQTTSSGSQQVSQLTSQLSMCMQIRNIYGNQVTLENCGKGVIENKSLVVTIDDIKIGASTQTIQEGNSSVVNISGLWQIPFGKHSLKISSGAAFAQNLVNVQYSKDVVSNGRNYVLDPNFEIANSGKWAMWGNTARVKDALSGSYSVSNSDAYNFLNQGGFNIPTGGGKTFTLSAWVKQSGDATILFYVYTGTGPDGGWYSFGSFSPTTSWQRFSTTRSVDGTVSAVQFYRHNQQGTIYIDGIQFEDGGLTEFNDMGYVMKQII